MYHLPTPPLICGVVSALILGCIISVVIHKHLDISGGDAGLSSSQIKDALAQLRLVFFADGVRNEAEYVRNQRAMRNLDKYIYTRDQRALEWLGRYASERLEGIRKGG